MIYIFTKDYCPYCVWAKELFTSLRVPFKEIDVTDDSEKLLEIVQISKMRTVPQIFYKKISPQTFLWWYSDVRNLHDEGKLLSIIS